MRMTLTAVLAGLGLALTSSAARAGETYAITELPPLGGATSLAQGLNDQAVVVGMAQLANGQFRATRWDEGVPTDLGTVGGNFSIAYDVNGAGRIVGQTEQGGFPNLRFGFYIDPGDTAQTTLENLESPPGAQLGNGIARTVNASGQMAGTSASLDIVHPVVWNEQGQVAELLVLEPLFDLETTGDVWDSNDANDLVGWTLGVDATSGFVGRRAVLWEGGTPASVPLDLGTLGGHSSDARGINAHGQIVGFAGTQGGGTVHAFLWEDGRMQDLGDLGDGSPGVSSFAHGINDDGVVVGQAQVALESEFEAFVWRDGVMRNLNDLVPPGSGWHLERAMAINASGQIAGVGTGPDGQERGFLLTLLEDDTWVGLGNGLAGTHGVPSLAGTGTLLAGEPFTIELEGALEQAKAFFVVGFEPLLAPFKFGVMVPDFTGPGFIRMRNTGASGSVSVASTWPSGVPSGFEFFVQYWIQDHAGPVGFAASNGLRGRTP